MSKSHLFIYPLLLFGLCFSACSEVVPLWKEQANLSGDYTLYRNIACEFEMRVSHPQPELNTRLELEVTYDVSSIGQDKLPLALFIERKDSVSKSFPEEHIINIPLKENGQWLGQASGNQVDNSLSYIVIPELPLLTNTPYALKIYANETDAIYGIVKIAARLYENLPPEEVED